jgi:hypothetical protein
MQVENLDWQNRVIFVPDSKTAEGRRLAVAPLLSDTDVLPDGHTSIHGRILSALGTYPGVLGEY